MKKAMPTAVVVRRLELALICSIVIAACSSEAAAQRPQRYQPSRPTVSPYLNLLRNNNSPLPNYYSLVRPQQRQLALNRQQQQLQLSQNTAIRQLQGGLQQLQTTGPVSGTPSWFQQPGSRYSFRYGARSNGRAGR